MRRGYVHVVNNDYYKWEMYAIGGSADPTVNSEGNRFTASDDHNVKEVQCCLHCWLNLLPLILCKFNHMHVTLCVCGTIGDKT